MQEAGHGINYGRISRKYVIVGVEVIRGESGA